MRKASIFIAMFLALVASVSAANYSQNRSDYYNDGTFNLAHGVGDSSFVQFNGTTQTNGDIISTLTNIWGVGAGTTSISNEKALTDGLSMKTSAGYIRLNSASNASFDGSYGCWLYLPDELDVRSVFGAVSGGQFFNGIDDDAPGGITSVSYYDQDAGDWFASSAGAPPKGQWFEIILNYTPGTGIASYICYENQSCQYITAGLLTSESGLQKIEHNAESGSQYAHFDNCWVSPNDQRPEATLNNDTLPPSITAYNCTSCNPPSGDSSPPFETYDTTPTFSITTTETALCRISSSSLNYTGMGTSRNCTPRFGHNTTHTCTLTVQDKFVSPGQDYLYFGCIDPSNNENASSTSGAVSMHILGASADYGDGAIQAGIDTSLLGSWANTTVFGNYTIVTRRQSDNSQFLGRFDKFVLNGNKRWAFNYVAIGEQALTGFFNLTPVLYILQLRNATNETITREVSSFINQTYP
ncbi:hypothetical protein HYV84_01505 [Candidatus Woesearchaeota archaeon]|nr:hypothetical protein [Candidatus Woesearchaeota archaeon]